MPIKSKPKFEKFFQVISKNIPKKSAHGAIHFEVIFKIFYRRPMHNDKLRQHSLEWIMKGVVGSTEGCIFMPLTKNGHRPGCRWFGKQTHVYVAVYFCAGFKLEPEQYVLHRCGNGHLGCINIFCLYAGTQTENIQDAIDQGTFQVDRSQKIQRNQVLEIRAKFINGFTQTQLARDYRVSVATIHNIVRYKDAYHL